MSQPPISSFVSDHYLIATMAFIGGFVDSSGFMLLKGLFTSSITGNIVVICASVAELEDSGMVARATCALSFMLAGFIGNSMILILKSLWKRSHNECLLGAYFLELCCLIATTVFGIVEYDNMDIATIHDWEVILPGCIAGAAMGFHCIAVRESMVNAPPTTVVTSTIINVSCTFSNAAAQYLTLYSIQKPASRECIPQAEDGSSISLSPVPQLENDPASQKYDEDVSLYNKQKKLADESLDKFITTVRPLIFFLAGAVIGAKITEQIHFWCWLIPIAIILYIEVELVVKILN